jgi:hypothetical protein
MVAGTSWATFRSRRHAPPSPELLSSAGHCLTQWGTQVPHQQLGNTRRAGSRFSRKLYQSALGIVAALGACERPTAVPPGRISPPDHLRATVVSDRTMGSLSAVALQVAIGLQDSRVRAAVNGAMKDSSAQGLGLDLQDCRSGGSARSLFDASERRGGQAADALCSSVLSLSGLVLFMDRVQLSNWDPSVIPIVTAMSSIGNGVPAHLLGYRSPDRTMDVTGDRNLKGPILVILPLPHPRRMAASRQGLPASVVMWPSGAASGGNPKHTP